MTKLLRRQAIVVILVLLAALGVGLTFAGTVLAVTRPVEDPDAIISLASHEWERLPATAKLAHANSTALVVLTLPQPATVYNCHDCSGRLDRLQRLGIPPNRVRIIPLTSPGTHGEALAALSFTRRHPIHRLLIVTTPYHARRALAVFRSVFQGSSVEIGIEPATEFSRASPAQWWADPYDRAYVAYEWAATLYYAVRYRVAPWQ